VLLDLKCHYFIVVCVKSLGPNLLDKEFCLVHMVPMQQQHMHFYNKLKYFLHYMFVSKKLKVTKEAVLTERSDSTLLTHALGTRLKVSFQNNNCVYVCIVCRIDTSLSKFNFFTEITHII